MINALRALNIRYDNFINKINLNIPIQKYFNINVDNLVFKVDRIENDLFLTLSYVKNFVYDIKELPCEMNRLIMTYLNNNLTVKIKISFTDNYPFVSPQWTLINVENHINHNINIRDYFQEMINSHNCQYANSWSPAINIENDILIFITRIDDTIFQT
jgi:ubiquitin-protein ligase